MLKIDTLIILFVVIIQWFACGCKPKVQETAKQPFGAEIAIADNSDDLISISESLGGYFITTAKGRVFFGKMSGNGFFSVQRPLTIDCDTAICFVNAKIAQGDTTLSLGVRNKGFQQRSTKKFQSARNYKIGFGKETRYSPYHFIEKNDGRFLIATSNGLYTTTGSNDTLDLVYPGKPTMQTLSYKDFEYKVYNIARCKQHYFAAMEDGLLKVDETGTDIVKILHGKVRYVATQNDTVFALVPFTHPDTIVHSEDFIVKTIPANGDAIALQPEGNKMYIFYPNATVLIQNGKSLSFPNKMNSYTKHPMAFGSGKVYSIKGDRLLQRLSNRNDGSTTKPDVIGVDQDKNKTYFLCGDSLFVSNNNSYQARLVTTMKTGQEKNSWIAIFHHSNYLYFVSKSRVYRIWKPLIWLPFTKMQPVMPIEDIKCAVQVNHILYLATRNGLAILDLNNNSLKEAGQSKYFESVQKISNDTLLLRDLNNSFLYFLTASETFVRPDKSQVAFFQEHPNVIHCNGWFDVSDNAIKRFSDSGWHTVVNGIPELDMNATKTDNKRLIYFTAKDGGCAILNTNTNTFLWLKVNDPHLIYKVAVGFGVILFVIILIVSVLKIRKDVQKNKQQIEQEREQLIQLEQQRLQAQLKREEQGCQELIRQQRQTEKEEEERRKLQVATEINQSREELIEELEYLSENQITSMLFSFKKQLSDAKNDPNQIFRNISEEVERLKKASVSEEFKKEFEKLNQEIAALCEEDRDELKNQLKKLEECSQFDALKGIFFIEKQIGQSKTLTDIRNVFKKGNVKELADKNFSDEVNKFRVFLSRNDHDLLKEKKILIKGNNDKFRLFVLLLATTPDKVSIKELAAALETDSDKEKSTDTIKNRKHDLKLILQNPEFQFESVIVRSRIKKLQEKWEKGNKS